MAMLDMMFNEQEKKKMMEGFGQVLMLAVQRGIEAKLTDIEQAVERVLVKHGIIKPIVDETAPPPCTCRGVEGCDSECELHGIK